MRLETKPAKSPRSAALVLVAAALAAVASLPIAPTAGLPGPGPTEAVHDRSYPDPFVLPVDGTYYAYATDGDFGEVQLMTSTDLVTWGNGRDALGSAPSWAQDEDVWAPAVTRLSATSYVLYASFVPSGGGDRCIGTATATSPDGPFNGVGDPIVCDDDSGGVIDPSVFVSGSTRYLLWKTEGVQGTEPPAVYSQPLSSDGLALTGSAARIFQSEQPWEGTLIENPSMISDPLSTGGTRTYLFYSGNEWESAAYGIGWAACAGPQGPCIAPPNRPLLTSEIDIYGPGGGAVFRDDEGIWMAFAAWTNPNQVTEDTGQRKLFLRRLTFTGGRPLLAGVEPPFTQRWAGANRYDTAAIFSANTVQSARPVTYVATGASYHDALIAAPAAGTEDSPVLLVEQNNIPQSVRTELARVNPGHIVVMGGPSAISDAVYQQLGGYSNGSIHREEGIDVYQRSALVSRNTHEPGVGVAYVATGAAFPDALAGGAAGAANDAPLLFVQPNAIPFDVGVELDRLNPQRIVVLGGPAAVSHEVLAGLAQYTSRVDRIAGVNRYETAAALASEFVKVNGSVAGVVVATGQNFPDAIAAGAAGWPVLLVPSTGAAPQAVKDALNGLNPLGVIVAGGTAAVSAETLASLGL